MRQIGDGGKGKSGKLERDGYIDLKWKAIDRDVHKYKFFKEARSKDGGDVMEDDEMRKS